MTLSNRSAADLTMMAVALADARKRIADGSTSERDSAIVRHYEGLDLTPEERATIERTPARFARLQSEFPDFDIATLPAIPLHWEDSSWHNDVCPSFTIGDSVCVFIDYANPQQREVQGDDGPRFSVLELDEGQHTGGEALLHSDSFDDVLRKVAEQTRLARLRKGELTRSDAEQLLRVERFSRKPCPDFIAHLETIIGAEPEASRYAIQPERDTFKGTPEGADESTCFQACEEAEAEHFAVYSTEGGESELVDDFATRTEAEAFVKGLVWKGGK
jgi:hypothetical protein